MFWGFIEKVTGYTREDVKSFVKARAVEFAKSVTCTCGCAEWQHERGGGPCLRCGDNCRAFQPQSTVTIDPKG